MNEFFDIDYGLILRESQTLEKEKRFIEFIWKIIFARQNKWKLFYHDFIFNISFREL